MTTSNVYFDLEADGLQPTQIWCVVCSLDSKDYVFTEPDGFKEFLRGTYDNTWVGTNCIGYDCPVLRDLWDVDFGAHRLQDTLVLSRLSHPDRSGGHSLKSWGERLRFPKGEWDEWHQYSPEMLAYCKQDVQVTKRSYEVIMEELKHFDPQSIELEHKVAVEIEGQRRNGWLLDTRKCHMLLAELKERKMECEDNVHKRFIPRPQAVKTITPKIKADGHLSKVGLQFMGDDYDMVGGPCTRVDFPPFNLGSRKQIGEYLCHFGWSPSKFTETGQPIVDEKILEGVNIPEAQMIAEYLMLEKRVAMVSSWVEAADGNDRVHGYVNSNGAVTGRMTHSSPNVAQVTANSKPFGTEMRQCWTVGPGNKLVGCDASGLELRMLAHYMNDPEYTDEVVNGDVHTKNMESAGLTSRPQAKTFIYAFLYGAGDAKIGSIVGGTARDGKDLKRQFLANTPALSNLRDRVEGAAGRGWLKGLDGRRVAVRSAYASLNTLLQSAGAIVMKVALVECVAMARQWPLDFRLVANVHDEFQTEVRESHADRFGKMAVYSIQRAGEILGLRCPLDAEYKIGTNWSETH